MCKRKDVKKTMISNSKKSKKSKKKNKYFTFETCIIYMIAICVIAMINLSNYKINEIFASQQESLLSRDISTNDIHDELENAIIEFRPDLCKMIEIYSLDFDQLLKMEFNPDQEKDNNNDIQDYPKLMNLLSNNTEGHTTIRTENEEEDVYFRQIELSNGQKCIMIIYMTRPIVEHLWIISFLGYIILILVFILLIYSYHQRQFEAIKYYKSLSKNVQDKMIR